MIAVNESGWISQSTFESLPTRFQRAALELERRGEIVIGDGRQTRSSSIAVKSALVTQDNENNTHRDKQ